MALKRLDQKHLFICHNYNLVGSSSSPRPRPGATYSTSGSKLTLDWIKTRHVRDLLTQPFSRQEPQVFSISSLKLKAGKLIMETNPFILNMLYNLKLWALEVKRKRLFCSDLRWRVTSSCALSGGGLSVSHGFMLKSASRTICVCKFSLWLLVEMHNSYQVKLVRSLAWINHAWGHTILIKLKYLPTGNQTSIFGHFLYTSIIWRNPPRYFHTQKLCVWNNTLNNEF